MILFLADLHGILGRNVLERISALGYSYHVLESYFYLKEKDDPVAVIDKIKADKVFLDSGAYSAFNKGIEIPVHEYAEFVAKYKDHFDVVASMDVKGNPEKSWENQKIMESFGLNPIPVYHVGEDIKWFYKYLDKYEYFGIGTATEPYHSDRLRKEFEQIFDIAPEHKFHGFGMTDTRWLQVFPWHTVDSLSWGFSGAYGGIKFWDKTQERTITATVSLMDKPRKKYKPDHIFNWGSPREKKGFNEHLERLKISLKEVAEENSVRCVVNIIYYIDFVNWINAKNLKYQKTEDTFF